MKKLIQESNNLSSAYYDNGEAKVSYFPQGMDRGYLHIKLDDEGKAVPYKISYEYTELNSGAKINIEVADNGFIIKTGGDTQIADSDYGMKEIVGKIINSQYDESVDYDDGFHFFQNLPEMLEEVEAELTR
ncbi:MAG: hypothetical protein JRJ00_00790 [Deltaproteobacteria bacterium]|nr:hypothetical protein [Deltaproteobacteria bacterium]